ncbi:MAG: ABC transporter permease, partial [Bacteroidales bacterium]|nr:ABC transporter permease [Bacteroidales bacterium]
YLITGYAAFDFFSNALNQASDSIRSYSFMITKVNFRLAILPIVKLLSGLMMHVIILFIVLLILVLNSIYPTLYWFQLIYYIFAMLSMLLGLAWIASSISLFFPDIKNIISIIVRLLFFLTPIFWSIEGLPESYAYVLKFNPFYYIVNGYRESLVYDVAFWEHPMLTIYYWALTVSFMLAGIIIFKKLRPHFADVI